MFQPEKVTEPSVVPIVNRMRTSDSPSAIAPKSNSTDDHAVSSIVVFGFSKIVDHERPPSIETRTYA